MERRNFLKTSSLAGISLTSLFWSPIINSNSVIAATLEQNSADDFSLLEATISDLQEQMQNGNITALQITKLYLTRIVEIDENGPALNSVIEINPDALAIAVQRDKERSAGKIRGPLHGIPVLIKDNIDTGDKMMTTAGSIALEGNYASKDAFIIQQLRDEGAVLLGKTNLSEWANFRSTRSSSGWSSRGGQTKNPYILTRNPCGSSSGSGVAVSANLCTVAIGTETDGSIICPSSVNGIVGIKPTVGLWSRSGIIPISATQDTAGPMARTVKDAAILLGALAAVDKNDAATLESQQHIHKDYTLFLKDDGLKGKRIGIEKSYLKGHEGVDDLFQGAIEALKREGATVIEVEVAEKVGEIGEEEYLVLQYEFKDGLNKYLAGANAQVKSLHEVIEFNKKYKDKAMPYFQQEILEASQAKGGLKEQEYLNALKKSVETAREIIQKTMEENNLDAISGPSYGPAWCTDLVNGDHFSGYGYSTPAAVSGYPHITVPMGKVGGLPIGFSFFGKAWSEPKLIEIAYAYEQATKNRVAPEFG